MANHGISACTGAVLLGLLCLVSVASLAVGEDQAAAADIGRGAASETGRYFPAEPVRQIPAHLAASTSGFEDCRACVCCDRRRNVCKLMPCCIAARCDAGRDACIAVALACDCEDCLGRKPTASAFIPTPTPA